MSSDAVKRKRVSACTAILFLLTGVSGLILLIAHPAHGSGQSGTFFIWKHIHEIAAIPFLFAAIIHIYINGTALKRYFRKG